MRDPDTPKPPSRVQQLELQLEAKGEEIQIKDTEIHEWQQKYEFAVSQSSEYPHEKEVTLNQLQAENSALRSSVNEWMTKHNDEKNRASWFEKQARSLGWEPDGMKRTPRNPLLLVVKTADPHSRTAVLFRSGDFYEIGSTAVSVDVT